MGIVDLEQVRVERLATDIAAELQTSGVARTTVSELDDISRWRRAARLAGRQLGWHVRTGASLDSVWVASEDWQAPPGSDRAAAIQVGALILGPGWAHSVLTFRRAHESARRPDGSVSGSNGH
jgi:hypothetical protein